MDKATTMTNAAATSPEIVVRRLLEEGFSQGRDVVVDELVAARISIAVYDVMRVVDGRIVEHWGLPDHQTLLSQIAR